MKHLCNICGAEFDMWDSANNFTFAAYPGYGSTHDGERISVRLCCRCFDRFADFLIPLCAVCPVEGEEES